MSGNVETLIEGLQTQGSPGIGERPKLVLSACQGSRRARCKRIWYSW